MRLNVTSKILFAIAGAWLLGAQALADEQSALADYQVQPGDFLDVSVWREPDLEREILVRPDGRFAFPLAGDVQAQGQTITQLRETLTEKLQRFVPDPVVTVSLKQMTGNRIYVLGRVSKPGEFTMLRPVNVLQALAMAGGLTPYADEKDIQILRGSGADQQSLPFNYADVQRGKGLGQNVLLQPGDVVMVP